MIAKKVVIFSALLLIPSAVSSQIIMRPGLERPQLRGLTPNEAKALIAKLEKAQTQLKNEEKLYFSLSGGSIASYDQAKLSPRQMFSDIPFGKVLTIDRVNNDHSLPRFRLTYAPRGIGQAYWEIETVLEASGNISSVRLMYKPPLP